MRITFDPVRTLQQCPECHHTSVHFFDDIIMCILCGWELKRDVPADVPPPVTGSYDLVAIVTDPATQIRPSRKQRRRRKKR